MKKAIHQIAAEILAEHKRPMSVEEIYEVIVSKALYEFKLHFRGSLINC